MKCAQVLIFFLVLIIRVKSNTVLIKKTEEHFARIVGGYRSKYSNTERHIVSLRYGSDHGFYGSNHLCGGSILTDRIILTAAHCIRDLRKNRLKDRTQLSVVVGNTDRLRRSNTEQTFEVNRIIPYPIFNRQSGYGDIALLHLKGQIEEDGITVQRVILTDEAPKEGQQCIFLGWGDVIFYGPAADELVLVNMTLLPAWYCAIFSSFVKEVICAGNIFGPYKMAAHGDSGGPLICNGTLVGVASYLTANRTYFSAVYYYRDWIEANSKNKSLGIFSNFLTVFGIYRVFYFLYWY